MSQKTKLFDLLKDCQPHSTTLRDKKGKFAKGNKGFWFGKKRGPLTIEWRKKQSLALKGKPRSKEVIEKITGSKNYAWKGDKVGYYALHAWLKKQLGKPSKCENPNCNFPNPKRYEWASKSHKAKRDLADYISLCPSCHRKFDNQKYVTN